MTATVGAAQPAAAKISIGDLRLEYFNEDSGVRHIAVDALSLEIRADEFLCVVGPSGCGKSTLIAAIAGFLKPRAGSLNMDGRPITGPGWTWRPPARVRARWRARCRR